MSQSEIHNEKILSGKDGTVTEAAHKNDTNFEASHNKLASTKYVDESDKNSVPQGVKSASIVHHFHKDGNTDEIVKDDSLR